MSWSMGSSSERRTIHNISLVIRCSFHAIYYFRLILQAKPSAVRPFVFGANKMRCGLILEQRTEPARTLSRDKKRRFGDLRRSKKRTRMYVRISSEKPASAQENPKTDSSEICGEASSHSCGQQNSFIGDRMGRHHRVHRAC
jgi:hypothetical protein